MNTRTYIHKDGLTDKVTLRGHFVQKRTTPKRMKEMNKNERSEVDEGSKEDPIMQTIR